ncbi:MAG: hypothetical protein EA393_13540 [Bacteroidetes bacterium]|nr:MAG: hypothetical protein EA393_13540 [Bacteroidota bacterium]
MVYYIHTTTFKAFYYHFGMTKHQQNYYGPLSEQNKMLYNSKELQDDVIAGINFDWGACPAQCGNYGARFYDVQIGRWHSVDPLAEHPRQINKSPYSALWNNPIRFFDPDGRCPECEENVINPVPGQEYESEGGATYTYRENESGELVWVRTDLPALRAVTVTPEQSDDRDDLVREFVYLYELLGYPIQALEKMARVNFITLATYRDMLMQEGKPLNIINRNIKNAGHKLGVFYFAGRIFFAVEVAGSIYLVASDFSYPKLLETSAGLGSSFLISFGGKAGLFAGGLYLSGKAEVMDRQKKMIRYGNPDYGGRYNPTSGHFEFTPWSWR